jgi:hypothetical protein
MVIWTLKLKVDTSYYAQRSIYENLTTASYPEPCSIFDLEQQAYLVRNFFEIELRNRRLIIPNIMKVFVLRRDIRTNKEFVMLYPEIGIKPLNDVPTGEGIIEYIVSPRNPTPCSNQVMEGWKLRKWLKTKDPALLGIPDPINYEDLFNIKEANWSHFHGM